MEHQSFQCQQKLQLTRSPDTKKEFFKLSVTDSKFCRNTAIGSRDRLWNGTQNHYAIVSQTVSSEQKSSCESKHEWICKTCIVSCHAFLSMAQQFFENCSAFWMGLNLYIFVEGCL